MDGCVWTHTERLNPLVPEAKRSLLKEGWTLSGMSVAALRTGFKMGNFRLDAGHSLMDTWDITLISHGHADHIFSVASLALANQGAEHVVYAPATALEGLELHVRSLVMATGRRDLDREGTLGRQIRWSPATPGEHITYIPSSRQRYDIEVFPLTHSIDTVGYGVSTVLKVANPELVSFIERYSSMRQFMRTKEIPVDVNETDRARLEILLTEPLQADRAFPQFCYLTDTSIVAIGLHEERISAYPIIIVECTFYAPEDIEHAHQKKHIHWQDLLPYIHKHTDSLWVLIHYSQRHLGLSDIQSYTGPLPPHVLIWAKDPVCSLNASS